MEATTANNFNITSSSVTMSCMNGLKNLNGFVLRVDVASLVIYLDIFTMTLIPLVLISYK